MKFYIASSRDRIEDVRNISAALKRNTLEDAFPWPDHFTHRCSPERCGVRDRDHLAHLELQAAGQCDLFIGLARLGKGSHVELGAALIMRVPRIILVGIDRSDSVFYDVRRVEHAVDMVVLLDLLGCVL